ncbi:folylpolyglutamate synthase/dihydrofolate synthase family protein [Zobellia sp. 1_MG-2023]|uniref:bifunctional folylpolyglutamate synthase/dihydrofolate synthase n=1 Tax=Zobellia sp. 1_MG-2023 TaxID=3062626 RepID=UPI0026E3D129|nr:folylpolyglutamate synthase/dihydrofolate synthase family protein [Zobellia sp. 1_MG-2023]MDO6819862.1 folylpolyglutamate synthase/dihydrofolate synthase family protein [Zobellia sp. 1_MG-2023]
MTYQETLDWMFAQLPMYQQKGKQAYNAKLDGIRNFANHLNHPENKFKSIHVAGTNGKGSSSHMLASILQEAGYKVGLYTSPHLKDFRERIRINGECVDENFVVEFVANNQSFFENYHLSFFEMTVGMAFDYFAKEKVDIAVVEVGLGGRLDSTNIMHPEVSLITNIGFDHVDMLGDTLPKIAFEKAGIIKEGVPVVVSEFQPETDETFRKVAKSKKAKLIYAEREIEEVYPTSLLGAYQKKNVKGVLAVIRQLNGFSLADEQIRKGLLNVVENTGLMGRWQQIKVAPTVICDTAHNKEGLSIVINQVSQQKFRKLFFVLGFVKGKDLDGILPLFPKDANYYLSSPSISRGLEVNELMDRVKDFGLNGRKYTSIEAAYHAALTEAGPEDFIFVGGSTFTVSEVI